MQRHPKLERPSRRDAFGVAGIVRVNPHAAHFTLEAPARRMLFAAKCTLAAKAHGAALKSRPPGGTACDGGLVRCPVGGMKRGRCTRLATPPARRDRRSAQAEPSASLG